MANDLSIMNDNDENNSVDKNADQEDIMMEVDGQADNASAEFSPSLDRNEEEEDEEDDEEDEGYEHVVKIGEYCMEEADAADTTVDVETIETVIIFDTVQTVNVEEIPDTSDNSEFMSLCTRVIDEYLENEDFKPILRLTQEQLLIDWLTSRHLLTKNDFDE